MPLNRKVGYQKSYKIKLLVYMSKPQKHFAGPRSTTKHRNRAKKSSKYHEIKKSENEKSYKMKVISLYE